MFSIKNAARFLRALFYTQRNLLCKLRWHLHLRRAEQTDAWNRILRLSRRPVEELENESPVLYSMDL